MTLSRSKVRSQILPTLERSCISDMRYLSDERLRTVEEENKKLNEHLSQVAEELVRLSQKAGPVRSHCSSLRLTTMIS